MNVMASQITGVSIGYSIVCSGADQRNIKAPRHWPSVTGEFPHKGPVTRKMLPFNASLEPIPLKIFFTESTHSGDISICDKANYNEDIAEKRPYASTYLQRFFK